MLQHLAFFLSGSIEILLWQSSGDGDDGKQGIEEGGGEPNKLRWSYDGATMELASASGGRSEWIRIICYQCQHVNYGHRIPWQYRHLVG